MRWPLALIVIASLSAAAYAQNKPSNPAFLGIGMADQQTPMLSPQSAANPQPQMKVGPCMVTNVMRGTGAMAAGLAGGDVLLAIEGVRVADCNAVLAAVQSQQPGDIVKVDILRSGEPQAIRAELLSRAEILRRRLVGAPVLPTELFAVDSDDEINLAGNRGKTTVVGWYDARCSGCAKMFTGISRWMRAQKDKAGAQPVVYAVMPSVDAQRTARSPSLRSTASAIDVPLALAEPKTYEEFTVPDFERVTFTVIDCRGVVQYTSSVAPDGDDSDAALDDLFAAAEQAARTARER